MAAGGSSDSRILLAGVVVNAVASAAITFLRTMAGPTRSQQLLSWLVGFLPSPPLPTLLDRGDAGRDSVPRF